MRVSMVSPGKMPRLCACLLNISEARRTHVVEQVAKSALKINSSTSSNGTSNFPIKSSVLNIFQDHDYNRSVITIVGESHHIGQSVFDACKTAFELIDLSIHGGGHPRLGSVDLVPIHPISEETTLEECGSIARDLATKITTDVSGASAFLFGYADKPLHRGLVERRKAVKWYSGGMKDWSTIRKADVGAEPSTRYGLTGIGAIPYVMNCNVTIDTQDVDFGRHIAESIRETNPGGLLGVQCMAFAHDGRVEIACNVEAVHCTDGTKIKGHKKEDLIRNFSHYYHVKPEVLEKRVEDIAREQDIRTVGTSLVGFTPETAEKLAKYALSTGRQEYWKETTDRRM